MIPIGRYTQRYTFALKICDSVGTLIDMTIGAAQAPNSLAKAKETIHKTLEEFTPMPIVVKEPDQGDPTVFAPNITIEAKNEEDKAEAPVTLNPGTVMELISTAFPEPKTINVPASQEPEATDKKPDGVKGLVHLHCSKCDSNFGTFLKEPKSKFTCKCGHSIDLTVPLARYRFTCPYCEKESWGYTNLEDPAITVRCKCSRDVELWWNTKAKEYRN